MIIVPQAKQVMCALCIVAMLVLIACERTPPAASSSQQPSSQSDRAMAMLSVEHSDGFRQAQGQREFVFPKDHGHHHGYRTEWWYVTGNLQAENGRRFGYQLTFFRVLLRPPAQSQKVAATATSAWSTAAVWLAQAAVSDIDQQRFYTSEQLSRELPGAAQAADDRLQVRVNSWTLAAPQTDPYAVADMELFMDSDDFSLQLSLHADKPVVLQGDNGLSRKSADDSDNASWYYSMTRLHSSGELRITQPQSSDEVLTVSGSSWLDREWSTSALNTRQAGWDWFALQLDNGHELMFYRLRLQNGDIDQASAGILVDASGQVTPLLNSDISAQPLSSWYDRQNNKRYPIAWRLQSAVHGIDLQLRAMLPNQAWGGRFQYWEGAVSVRGEWQEGAVTGRGYVELTGYD